MENFLKKIRTWIDDYLAKAKQEQQSPPQTKTKTIKQKMIYWSIVFVLFFYIVSAYQISQIKQNNVQYTSYSEFEQHLKNGDIDIVYYNDKEEVMSFVLLTEETKKLSNKERQDLQHDESEYYYCQYPSYDEFRKDVLSSGAEMKLMPNSKQNLSIILSLLPTSLYLVFIFLMLSKMGGTFKAATEKELIQTSDIKFDDIIGHDEILDDVKFVTTLMQNPSIGENIGAKMPKGLLFSGPPGTGKTLLAKAIAHEAGVPFLYQNASGLVEMYVGLGARRVRELFKIARKNAPCIIFFDEIDAIGGKRGDNRNTSEHEQTLNALLQEMDGFNSRDGIFVIAATNRPEELDEALVRSGRFDRQIVVSPPQDASIRKDLFEHYLSKFETDDGIDIESISKQTAGFTGADIAAICNEASIIAAMQGLNEIDTACLNEAIDKKIFKGNKSKKEKFEKDREIVAYHEAGHAVMSLLLNEPVARASIQATTSGVGGAVFNEDKESVFQTNTELEHRIMIAYAGRASEEIKFNEATTGASNDITQATHLMTQYVEKLGFDQQFGLLDVEVLSRQHLLNGENIMNRVSEMSVKLYDKCKKLLQDNYEKVEIVARALLDKETISGEMLSQILKSSEGGDAIGSV